MVFASQRNRRFQTFSRIPGARDFLCSLIEDPAFAVSLASGAWEGSARFKLACGISSPADTSRFLG